MEGGALRLSFPKSRRTRELPREFPLNYICNFVTFDVSPRGVRDADAVLDAAAALEPVSASVSV